jgi:hypothetical protein
MSRLAVAEGYASLMSRYAMPVFVTQTFENRAHPETVVKAHRHFLNLWNCELHGNHWKRRGIEGCQSILGVERHKSGQPHSHAVVGHPDLDLAAPEFSPLRRLMRLTCEDEWGFAKIEVAESQEHVNAYVSKYICKDGEIEISPRIESLGTGQLSLIASSLPSFQP